MRFTLETINHTQQKPGTPLKTDNKTSHEILKNLIKPKKSKTWDMRYHWIEDRIKQKEINLHWKPGIKNWADYFTKHFAPAYHKIMRKHYLIAAAIHYIKQTNSKFRITQSKCEGVLQRKPTCNYI